MHPIVNNKKNEIALAESYDPNVAIRLPFAWNWERRYYDSINYMFSFCIAVDALDCAIGDIILDIASGSGWTTELLNRLGFNVVAIDLSTYLLKIGKDRINCDNRIETDKLKIEFICADGEKLPFKDESFDGVICMNSLHHFPDYYIILNEMNRVMKKDAIASFSEPGKSHTKNPMSKHYEQTYGIYEKDVDIDEIYKTSISAGFKNMSLKPIYQPGMVDYTYDEWNKLRKKEKIEVDKYIDGLVNFVEEYNILFQLHKSEKPKKITSRKPNELNARLHISEMKMPYSLKEKIFLKLNIENIGDTIWKHEFNPFGGYVRIGGKLLTQSGEILANDFRRAWLPKDIFPGESIELEINWEPPEKKGSYVLKIDLVCENIAWFESRGSMTKAIPIEIIKD